MPREDRRIHFDYDETYKAIFALCVQRAFRKPPPGVIRSVSFNAEDAARVEVRFDNPLEEKSETVEYARDFLAAALMLYCRTVGVPLPKNAQKSVDLTFGGVILRIQI